MISELQTRQSFGIKLDNRLFWSPPIVAIQKSFGIGESGRYLGGLKSFW